MNISKSFALYMEDMGFGFLGTDIFIGSAPQDGPNEMWWIVAAGGSPESRNDTNEMIKNYSLSVYFRDIDQENVYNTLQEFEKFINSDGCPVLDGFDIISLEASSFPSDQDLDTEERTVGLVQINVKVYSE